MGDLADALDRLEDESKGLQFSHNDTTYTLEYMDGLEAICAEDMLDDGDEIPMLGPVPYNWESTIVTLFDEFGDESEEMVLREILFTVVDLLP
jgi:hypothetical protein